MKTSHTLADSGPFAIDDLAATGHRLRNGEITSVELTEQALNAADTIGSRLNCFVTIDHEGALQSAQKADEELRAGRDRGPLHGIPTAVKDLILTSGVLTTMGSQHFAGQVPDVDADVVITLRNNGAINIGKTHTHEFAYGPTGDRAHTGPALNPHNLEYMTGGSSSGSAAAVAAGIVPFAIGTDTAGSIRIPSAMCGTVGLKPSAGTISSKGVFPFGPSFDTVGPITRSVADTEMVMAALTARADVVGSLREASSFQAAAELRYTDLRIGVVSCALTDQVEKGPAAALDRAVDGLIQAGSSVSTAELPELDECTVPHLAMLSAESYAIHRKRVEQFPELFDPEVLERLQAAASIPGWQYVEASNLRPALQARTLNTSRAFDAFIMPTIPIETPQVDAGGTTGSKDRASLRAALKSLTVPWSYLDFPSVNVPVHLPGHHLPYGVQVVGRPGEERELLRLASLVETVLRS